MVTTVVVAPVSSFGAVAIEAVFFNLSTKTLIHTLRWDVHCHVPYG